MVLRVTQQSLYGSIISQNNAALSKLMATNLQSSTQKRINAPSDDPNGTVQVLGTRADISQLTQYQTNIDTANGWLKQADSTLGSVSTLITTIKGLAEQGATGSITESNREEIGTQIRQYFDQLISLANTTYNGSALFAGQKTDAEAYTRSLWMQSNDTAFEAAATAGDGFTIQGDSDATVLVQFRGAPDTTTHQPAFQYSSDGGTTWTDGTYAVTTATDSQQLVMGGVTMTVSNDALDTVTGRTDPNDTEGTWMWIRPTAVYQGNTNDDMNVVTTGTSAVTGTAEGVFSGNVMVRADAACDFTTSTPFAYSYSTDGGTSWVSGNTSGTVDTTDGLATLAVPGGLLQLAANGDTLAAGQQFFIQPSTADISVAISPTDAVVVNGVGTEIFGGVDNGQAVTFGGSDAANLFETVGKLVGYLETNNQAGCQEALDNLTASQEQVLTAAASVGARENRVTATETMVQSLAENAGTQLSTVEDADLTELITRLAQQELAYQAVLKSSSTVMNLSLVSYI